MSRRGPGCPTGSNLDETSSVPLLPSLSLKPSSKREDHGAGSRIDEAIDGTIEKAIDTALELVEEAAMEALVRSKMKTLLEQFFRPASQDPVQQQNGTSTQFGSTSLLVDVPGMQRKSIAATGPAARPDASPARVRPGASPARARVSNDLESRLMAYDFPGECDKLSAAFREKAQYSNAVLVLLRKLAKLIYDPTCDLNAFKLFLDASVVAGAFNVLFAFFDVQVHAHSLVIMIASSQFFVAATMLTVLVILKKTVDQVKIEMLEAPVMAELLDELPPQWQRTVEQLKHEPTEEERDRLALQLDELQENLRVAQGRL